MFLPEVFVELKTGGSMLAALTRPKSPGRSDPFSRLGTDTSDRRRVRDNVHGDAAADHRECRVGPWQSNAEEIDGSIGRGRVGCCLRNNLDGESRWV
jgi:hypothetical protein